MINGMQQVITPEMRANIVLAKSCINEDGSYSTPTPEKLLKNISDEIDAIKNSNDNDNTDAFILKSDLKNTDPKLYASMKPTDVKNGIKFITEVLGMLTALDASMKSLTGYSVKDLFDYFMNKKNEDAKLISLQENQTQVVDIDA